MAAPETAHDPDAEPEDDPRTDEEKLFPERFARLADGSTVKIEPWSYVQGREMMFGLVGTWIDRYDLLREGDPALDLLRIGHDELMRIVQAHFGWDDDRLGALAYQDALELATCIYDVNVQPLLGKSFGLVARLSPMRKMPHRLTPGSPSPSSS